MNRKEKVLIEESIQILEMNLTKIDRVSEWSEYCVYVDGKIFSRLFRNHFGFRPKLMMNKLKIEKAVELLADGEMSNYEVAHEIGKKDEKALYSFFKQQTGKAPEFYRSKKSE